MLQKLRDSSNIAGYVKHVENLEKICQSLSIRFHELFTKLPGKILITYHRHGYLPASIMYWFVTTMDPDKNVVFNEANALTYYILPYHEQGGIVFFSSNPYSSSTINLLQTSRLTGYESVLVTLKPRDERVANILSHYNVIYVDLDDELEATLVTTISVYYALSKVYSGRLGSRGARLHSHAREGLSPIVEELIDKYIDKLEHIVRGKKWFVTSSKLLEPVSMYLVDVLRRLEIKAYYQPPEQIPGYENVLLLSTSVEEHLARELKFKYNVMGAALEDLTLNTDPLEAQVYIALLAYYLVYSLGGKEK